MSTMGRLLLLVVPLLAALAFFLAQKPLGGIAPAPPVSVPGPTERSASPPRSIRREPTILAPQSGEDAVTYPPGASADGFPGGWPGGKMTDAGPLGVDVTGPEAIPIPDLRRASTATGTRHGDPR